MGPHTFNFKEAAENSAAAGAAFRVADLPAAMDLAYQMLQNEELLNQSQQAGSGFIDQHRGAAERTALAIVAALAQSKNQAHA
jgi:3-deoxy-D-manno-octulosonic-acid transferase